MGEWRKEGIPEPEDLWKPMETHGDPWKGPGEPEEGYHVQWVNKFGNFFKLSLVMI